MYIRISIAACSVLVAVACSESPPPPPDPQSPSLDVVAARAVEAGFPGVTLAVGLPDGSILTAAAGLADRATGLPMTPDSVVHAASVTKSVTAAAALRLVDGGRLTLEARLTELLPPKLLSGVPHVSEMTVRHLLLHTSGLYSPNNDPRYVLRYIGPERVEKPFWRPEEIVAFAADPDNSPAFAPGEGVHYSDINYVLLSRIVEAVAGEPFKTFVAREILEPLHMRHTRFLSDDPRIDRARGYTVDSEMLRTFGLDPALVADEDGLIDTTDAQEQSDGGAGLLTTSADMVRFARALVDGDFLSAGSRALILEVADRAVPRGEGEVRGALRAYRMPYGVIVAAEGDGPGTHFLWAWHVETGRIVAAGVNLFGRWDENDYLLETLVPGAIAGVFE